MQFMQKLPRFLTHYELPADTDERAIKRVYARELKKIDQELDSAGFQDLRDSYEIALSWVRCRDSFQEHLQLEELVQIEDDAVLTADVEGTPLQQDLSLNAPASEPHEHDTGRGAPEQESELVVDTGLPLQSETQQPEVAEVKKIAERSLTPEELAKTIFSEMLDAMRLHVDDDDFAGQNLILLLDDARLFHMETRLHFESMLAHYLLQGWQPGNGELFDTVVQSFGWEKDRRRLLNLGSPGYAIDRALTEAADFYRKDKKARAMLWALVKKIRKGDSPNRYYLKANLGLLRHIQSSYPSWLRMVTSQENLVQWLAQAEEMQKQYVVGDDLVLSKEVDTGVKPVYWIVIVCIVLFGMFTNRDRSPPKYQPGQFAPGSHMSFSVDTPDAMLSLEQRMQKAETLLSMSKGDKEKFSQAVRSLQSVAGADNDKAAYRLGWLYRDNKYAPADKVKQYAWFLRAAELGNLQASVIVGDLVMDGVNGKVDHQEALQHYKKAADKGHALGQFKLAYMIDHGFAIKRNEADVARLIKASADQGFAYSESLMGQFALRGEYGFEKNETRAANWFSLSAKHGDPSGERYFAQVNERGLGGYKINLAEAAKWYGVARDHGDKDAAKSLQSLCKKQEFAACKQSSPSINTISVVTRAH